MGDKMTIEDVILVWMILGLFALTLWMTSQ